ncbi:hypothetical protein cyc_06831 [Cyclospora cayetanensis]|uniref:Uncharacterized protein n=1 Tax=Cyclospora cayetanensis TaxID=88456 RepID=A0A1D3D0J8_9EIME|nr:hypothetical protein cyc_06831 [Cyclospora cayetanensis]
MKEGPKAPQDNTPSATGNSGTQCPLLSPLHPPREGDSSGSRLQPREFLDTCSAPVPSEYKATAFAALSGFLHSALAAGGAAAATAAAVPQRLASLAAAAGQTAPHSPAQQQQQKQQQQRQHTQQPQPHVDLEEPLSWRCPFHCSDSRRSPPAPPATGASPRGRHLQRASLPVSGSRNRSSSHRGPLRRHRLSSRRAHQARPYIETNEASDYAEYLALHVEKWREGSFDRLEVEADSVLFDPLQARCKIM